MSSTEPDDLGALVATILRVTGPDGTDALGLLDVLWLAATMDAAARAEADPRGSQPPGSAYRGKRRLTSLTLREQARLAAAEATRADVADDADGTDRQPVFDDYDDDPLAGPGGMAARRVTLSGEDPLPGQLGLARALRPLRQWSPSRHRMVLDVEATVRASSAAGHTLPVLRPGRERRFSVDLVYDVGPSMLVWRDTFAELVRVFRYAGAFGDVKQWGLHTNGDVGDVWLTDRSGRRWAPAALRRGGRRRITVIVTDAVGRHWYTPLLWQHLTDWGARGSVALLDLLPLKLWNFSGIGPNRVRVHATSAAAVNAELRFNPPRRWRLAGRSAPAMVPFPVMELSPAGLVGWSAMVASAHPAGSAALLVEAAPPYGMPAAPPERSDGAVSLKNFRHTATADALRLAVLAATVPSTTIGVLRAIQRELLPHSPVSDLAQVLVSGIYRQVPGLRGEGVRVVMDPGCRTELQELASPQDQWDVVRAVSTVIQRDRPATAARFQAAVRDLQGDIMLPRGQRAFAELARSARARALGLPPPTPEVSALETPVRELPPPVREVSASAPDVSAAQGVTASPGRNVVINLGPEEGLPRPSPAAGPQADPPHGWDFYISYAQADRAWAGWIAWVLEEDGYRVLVQAWDFVPGDNWVERMQDGMARAARTIAVLSPDYLQSHYGTSEWQAALASDPTGQQRRLLPVRVADIDRSGLLAGIVTVDLFGISQQEATARLRAMVGSALTGRAKPAARPTFPGSRDEARFPGSLPVIWNLPPRNPHFTGRDAELADLADRLTRAPAVTVASLRGMGGVGKTQLVTEFAYRHATDYDLVFWIAAEEPATIPDQFAILAAQLGLDPVTDPDLLRRQVHDHLHRVRGWLLIFDNADDVEAVRRWIPRVPMPPRVPGQVIVTTRRGGFSGLGPVQELDVVDLPTAVALLRTRVPDLPADVAQAIADELGRLPLALEQAAAYLDRSAMPARDYLNLLRRRAADLYGRGTVSGRAETIATLWHIALQRIGAENPAAVLLLELCSYLAPDPIPLDLFTMHARSLPEPLARAVADELAFAEVIATLVDYSLVKRDAGVLQVHRLVQGVVRANPPFAASESGQQAADPLTVAVDLLVDDLPADVATNPRAWARWATLLPHVLAVVGHAAGSPAAQLMAARLLLRAGTYLRIQGRPAEAQSLLERGAALAEAVLGPDSSELAEQLTSLALAMLDLGRLTEARTLAERALAVDEAALGPDDPLIARDLGNLAQILRGDGLLVEARPLVERALAIHEAVGPVGPEIANDLNQLAQILRSLGQLSEAQPLAERALAIHEAVYGPDHPEVASDLGNLAAILAERGRRVEAQPLFERALDIDVAAYGPEHPNVADDLTNLAQLLYALGRRAEAQPLAERALAIDEAAYGPDHPEVARDLTHLAEILAGLGQRAQARPAAEQAVAVSERALGPDHPYTVRAREVLAQLPGPR